MNETQFNAGLRAVLRAQGFGALHIREADQPGAADLILWGGQRLSAWVELKIEDHEVEPQQWQFLEDRVKEGGRAFVVRLRTDFGRPFQVSVARVVGRDHQVNDIRVIADYHKVDWTLFL